MFASMVKVFWSACSEIYATDIISRQYFHDQHIGKIRVRLKGLKLSKQMQTFVYRILVLI